MMKHRKLTFLGIASAAALMLAACTPSGGNDGSTGSDPADRDSDAAIELLGGADAAAEMDELYQKALDEGQTRVTIYGPGETDKVAMYEMFSARFPGITVDAVYILGPDYAAKLEGEYASGQHVADIVQTGDTAISQNLRAGYIEPFKPITANTVDQSAYSDAEGSVWAASASTFGYLYNTNLLSEDEAPKGWDDLLDPNLQGKMTSDNLTRTGAGFGTISHLMWDGNYDLDWVAELAAQDITFQSSSPVAGSAVATGQFAVQPVYPMAFYLRDLEKGAPVSFVFPTEGGVHLSPHYVGILNKAPNPDAARLLMAWLFTPEAQQAAADLGYYPLVPGQQGPDGLPPVDELDLLRPFNLADVGAVMSENLTKVQGVFAD